MGLTPSQQNAVDVRDRTLLVSAAAGSGKTYTLTQRIIKSIIEDEQDLSRLLIVTFTRAAAGELKAKISKALGAAIAEHPENLHLQKQLSFRILFSKRLINMDHSQLNQIRSRALNRSI